MPAISLDDLHQQAPFSLPIPADKLTQIKAFVREMAVGAVMDYWEPLFMHANYGGQGWVWESLNSETFDQHVVHKWGEQQPSATLLQTLGYLAKYGEQGLTQLTPAAYALLEETPPINVFISYARRESSALALLILARMKSVGMTPFLDIIGLEPGDAWSDRLDSQIRNSAYLIAVLGPTSLESSYVRHEINLAHEAGVVVLPFLHNGLTPERLAELQATLPEAALLLSRQAIKVERETTEDYNRAIVSLLNRFGVTP